MNKLLLGALVVMAVACSKDKKMIVLPDADTGSGDDGGTDECNVLAQTGCAAGQKCSWVRDSSTPGMLLGHIGCVMDGTKAVGDMCMYGPDGATGYDDCQAGLVCQQGRCKTICDTAGGTPMCDANHACARYEGLFANPGDTAAAGVCDPKCDPLDDNDFDGSAGSNVPAGSACPDNGSQSIGCYGFVSDSPPTRWSCTRQVTDLTHRAACTTASGCANAGGSPYINGCAQGYLPSLIDMTGSTQVVCVSLCKPGNTYLGNVTQAPAGVAPHRCNNTDARGNFDPATAGVTPNNGDHCMYSWLFELDANGMLVRSTTSDTVGYCVNHKNYRYDSNGDGMVNTQDMNWPACSTLPDGFGSGSAVGAADFGCVDTTHAGLPFDGKSGVKHPLVEMPRFPYHSLAAE